MLSREAGRFLRNYKVNKVIKFLILSDFAIWSGNQLFAPIIAIFISDNLIGGSVEAAGIAVGIFLITKSLFEIPVGIYIDRSKTERDDLYSAVIGTIFTAVAIFLYSVIQSVQAMYALQVLFGIGAAVAYPGWYSIFTRHIDEKKEAFEWSLYDVLLGAGMASTAALGGFVANQYGFSMTFYIASVATFIGAIMLFAIRKQIR